MRRQVDRQRVEWSCMVLPHLPELGLEVCRRNRDEQISQRLQGGVKGCLIALVRGLPGRGRRSLRRNSAGSAHVIRDLLSANPARVPLIVVGVTGKERIRKNAG